jgi:hypothetical protein
MHAPFQLGRDAARESIRRLFHANFVYDQVGVNIPHFNAAVTENRAMVWLALTYPEIEATRR